MRKNKKIKNKTVGRGGVEMKSEEFLDKNISCTWNQNVANLNYFLDLMEEECEYVKIKLIFTELENKDIPLEVSVYKLFKGFPICANTICYKKDDIYYVEVVKGGNEIQNILKWMNEDIEIIVNGKNVKYSDFDERDRAFLKNRYCITLTILKPDDNTEIEEFKEIIKKYV